MDTTLVSSLGDVTTLFTALRSVHGRARMHLLRLNEHTEALTEMTRRNRDARVRGELDEIARLLADARGLLYGRDTLELGRAVLAFGPADSVGAQDHLAEVVGDVAVLLDQCLCTSAHIEGLLIQAAQRLSELEAAEV
ncbi:MAG TPA: hypothetical protein VFL86_27355 [Burkholderiaceae bacterium]|nr:hypothetical protein [Burkholderiaceae bacterium]